MRNNLNDAQIEEWRMWLKEMRADSDLVAGMNDHTQERQAIQKKMVVLLDSFLSGKMDLEEFRETFDNKTKSDWRAIALNGFGGGMFLNKLVKYISDSRALTRHLKAVLPVPANPDDGIGRMRKFSSFLIDLIKSGEATKDQLAPGRIPFFISAWWHVQDMEKWPIFYPQVRSGLEAEEIYIPSGDFIKDYFSFRDIFVSLASALGIKFREMECLSCWSPEDGEEEEKEEPSREDLVAFCKGRDIVIPRGKDLSELISEYDWSETEDLDEEEQAVLTALEIEFPGGQAGEDESLRTTCGGFARKRGSL